MWGFVVFVTVLVVVFIVGFRYFRARPYDKSAAAKAQQELDAEAKSVDLGEQHFSGRTDPLSPEERKAKGL